MRILRDLLYEQWDAGGIFAHNTVLLKKDLTLVLLEKSLTLNVMSGIGYTLKSAS